MSFFDDLFARKKDPPKKSARKPKAEPVKKPAQPKKPSKTAAAVSKSNANLSAKPHSSGQLRASKSIPDIAVPFSKPSTSHVRREGILDIAPKRSSRNLNLPKPHEIIPLAASTSVNHNNNVIVHTEKAEATNHVADLIVDESNVTFRKVQGTNKNDQAGDDLSRSSSITNLSDTKSKGASSKIKKSASKDRLDKISDKKSDKKGLTKNNNKIEDTATYSTESLQEIESLQRQLQEMANEKNNLALQLGEEKGNVHVLESEMLNLKKLHEQLNQENNLLRNRLKDVAHSPLSDNEKQQLLLESHRHHSSAPASIATNLIEDASAGDVTACPTPDWDKHSSSNVSEISVACLQDRINQMEETHYSTKEELQATVQELNDLQKQLTELQQDNYQLLEEKNLMFDSLCRQTERLNESKNEIETLKQRLREKEDTGQYDSAVEHEQKILALLKDAQQDRDILLLKQEQLTNELQEALTQNTQHITLIEQFNERIKTLESTLDAKHAEHKQLEQEMVVLKDQSSGRQIEIDRLSDLLENARTKIVELEQDRALSDKSELDELLDNARKEKDALESEVTNLKEQVARSKNESEKLKDQVSILQEECKVTRNNAKCTQSELEYKCEILTADKNALNEQLLQLQEAANGLQMQAQCQLEDKRQLSSVLSETQKLLSEAERRNQELEGELEDLKKLRKDENEEWEKFQNDLLTSVRVANDFKTEAQQDLQKMILENKAHREKVRHLEAQIDKLRDEDDDEEVQLPLPPTPQFSLRERRDLSQANEIESSEADSLPPPPSEIIQSLGKEDASVDGKKDTAELDSTQFVDLSEDVDLRHSPKSKSSRPGSTKSFFKKPKIFRNHKGYYVSGANSLENPDSGTPSLSEQGPQSIEPVDFNLVTPPVSQATPAIPLEILQVAADKVEDNEVKEMESKDVKSKKTKDKRQKTEVSQTVVNKSEVRKSKKDGSKDRSSKQHLSSQEQKDLKSLNELYSAIDPNIPEEFLSPEQKFIVKLKKTYDSTFERNKTKPVANKPKNSLAISKPLLTSVISNPKLKQIADDPTVRVVEDDATKNLYNTSNVFYPAPQPTTSAKFDDIHASSIQFSYYNAEDARNTTMDSFKPDGTLPKSKSLNDLYFKKDKDLNKIANYPFVRQHSTGSLTNFASTSRPSTLNPVVRRPESIASTLSDSGGSEVSLANIANKNQGSLGETLDELCLKIDPNVPETELTEEQKFVKKMKMSVEEMGRKSTLRKESKRNVIISEPTKESVWNNPKLASVIKDTNTPEIKVEPQKENKIKKLFGIFKPKKDDSPPPPKKVLPKRQISQEDIVHVTPSVEIPKKQKESKQKSEAGNVPKHKSESSLIVSKVDKTKGNLTKQKSESNLVQLKLPSETNLTKPNSDLDLIQEAEPIAVQPSESTSSLFKSVITNSDLQKLIENRNSPNMEGNFRKKAYENEDNSSFNSDLYEDSERDDFTDQRQSATDPYASDATSSTTSSKKEIIHRISSIPPTESFNTFVKQKISPSTPKTVFDYDDLDSTNTNNTRGNLKISIGFNSLDSNGGKLQELIEDESVPQETNIEVQEPKPENPKEYDRKLKDHNSQDEDLELITRKPKPNQEYIEKLFRNRITTTEEYLAASQPNQVGLNQLSEQALENKKSHLFIKNAPKYKKQISSPSRPPPPPPIAPRPRSELLLRKKESEPEPPKSKDDQNYFSFSFKFQEPNPSRPPEKSDIKPLPLQRNLIKNEQALDLTQNHDEISSKSVADPAEDAESKRRDSFIDLNFKFEEPITSVTVSIEEKNQSAPVEVQKVEHQSSGDDRKIEDVESKLENQVVSVETRIENVNSLGNRNESDAFEDDKEEIQEEYPLGKSEKDEYQSFGVDQKIEDENQVVSENISLLIDNKERVQGGDLVESQPIIEEIKPSQSMVVKSKDLEDVLLIKTPPQVEDIIVNASESIEDTIINPPDDFEPKPIDEKLSDEPKETSTSAEDDEMLDNESTAIQKQVDPIRVVENVEKEANAQINELETNLNNQKDVEIEDFEVIEPPSMFLGDDSQTKDQEAVPGVLEESQQREFEAEDVEDVPIVFRDTLKIETDESSKEQVDSETLLIGEEIAGTESSAVTPIALKNEEEGGELDRDLVHFIPSTNEVEIRKYDNQLEDANVSKSDQEISVESENLERKDVIEEVEPTQAPKIVIIEDTKECFEEKDKSNREEIQSSSRHEEKVEIIKTIEEVTSASLTLHQDRVEIRQTSCLYTTNTTDFERDSLNSSTSFSTEIDDTDPNFGSILNTKSKCSRQSSISSEEEIFRRLSYKLDPHDLSFLRDVYKKYEVDRPKSPINDTDIAVIERAKLNTLSPEFEDTPLTFDPIPNLDSEVFFDELRKDCQGAENDDEEELTTTEMELIKRIKSTTEDRPVSAINEKDLKIIETIRQETLNRKSRKGSVRISAVPSQNSVEIEGSETISKDLELKSEVVDIQKGVDDAKYESEQRGDVETGEVGVEKVETFEEVDGSSINDEAVKASTEEATADEAASNTKNDYLETLLVTNLLKKNKDPPPKEDKPSAPQVADSQRPRDNDSEDLFDFLRKPTPKKVQILKANSRDADKGDSSDFVKNIEARNKPFVPDPPKKPSSNRTSKIAKKLSLIDTLLDDDDPVLPKYSISSWVKKTTPKRSSVNEAIKARQSLFLQNQADAAKVDDSKPQPQKFKTRESWKSQAVPRLSLESQHEVLEQKKFAKSLDEIGMLPPSSEDFDEAPVKLKAKIGDLESLRTTPAKVCSDDDFTKKIFAKYDGLVRTGSMTSDLFRSPRIEERSRGVYKSNSIGGRSDSSLNTGRSRSVEPPLSFFGRDHNFSSPERTPSPMGYEPIYANYKELQSPKKPLLFRVSKPPIPSPRHDTRGQPSEFKIDSSNYAFDRSSREIKMDDPGDPKKEDSPASIGGKDRDKNTFIGVLDLDPNSKKKTEDNAMSTSGAKPKKDDEGKVSKNIDILPLKTSSMEILYDSEESAGISEKSSVDKSYLELFKSPEQVLYENLSESDKNKHKTTFTTLHFFKSGDISSESSNASTQDEGHKQPSNKVSFLRKKFEQSQKQEGSQVIEETSGSAPIEKTQSIPANHVLRSVPKASNLPQNVTGGEKQQNHPLSPSNTSLENLRKSGRKSFENARSVFEVKVKKQESGPGEETISETTGNDDDKINEAQVEDAGNVPKNDQLLL